MQCGNKLYFYDLLILMLKFQVQESYRVLNIYYKFNSDRDTLNKINKLYPQFMNQEQNK